VVSPPPPPPARALTISLTIMHVHAALHSAPPSLLVSDQKRK
jgi:hypothetical protein